MSAPTAMAALTTLAGFLALLTSTMWPQRDFGIYTGIGVVYAGLLALTLIPAILVLLPLPQKERRSLLSKFLQGRAGLANLARLVGAVPVGILIAATLISIFWAVGLPRLRVESSPTEFMGKDSPVTRAIDVLDRHFGGSLRTGIEIDTGRRDGLKEPESLKKMLALQEFLQQQPGVHRTLSLTNLVRELNQKFHADDLSYYVIPEDRKLVAQLLLLFTFQGGSLGQMALTDFSSGEIIAVMENMSSTKIQRLVKNIQKYLDEHFGRGAGAWASDGSPQPIKAEQVGISLVYARLISQIQQSQVWSLATSIGASWLIVALLMGSAIAGLLCILPLVLTIIAEFGVMSYAGLSLDMNTMMIGSISIGIGIDYAIHFVERYRQEYTHDGEARRALEQTLANTGAGITYNALALMLGFAVLFLSTFKGLNTFGLLIALTMIVSATSAFTVIPAVLLLWRPAFLTRRAVAEPVNSSAEGLVRRRE